MGPRLRTSLFAAALLVSAASFAACSTAPAAKTPSAPASTIQGATEADASGSVPPTPSATPVATNSSPGISTDTQTQIATGVQTSTATSTGTVLSQSGLTVIRDIVLSSAEGSHSQAITCPTGYQPIAAMADCGYAVCNGNQGICIATVQLAAAGPTEQLLVGLSMTPSNTHVAGGIACPAGWASFGSTADCGDAVCNAVRISVNKRSLPPPSRRRPSWSAASPFPPKASTS